MINYDRNYRRKQGWSLDWFADPIVQTAVLPLVVTIVLAGLLRWLAGAAHGPLLAAGAIVLGYLAAYAAILGLPPLVPLSATHKLFHMAAIGLVLGSALDVWRAPRGVVAAVLVAATTLGLAWVGESQLAASASTPWLLLGLLWFGLVFVAIRIEQASTRDLDAPVLLLVGAMGVGAIAVLGASASYGQLGLALAAATGGFLLWNWPVARFRFAATGLFASAAALAFLAAGLALFTKSDRVALVLLVLVFVADLAARPILPAAGPSRPVVLTFVALIPAAAAVALAYARTEGPIVY